eukprot:IDg1350t1
MGVKCASTFLFETVTVLSSQLVTVHYAVRKYHWALWWEALPELLLRTAAELLWICFRIVYSLSVKRRKNRRSLSKALSEVMDDTQDGPRCCSLRLRANERGAQIEGDEGNGAAGVSAGVPATVRAVQGAVFNVINNGGEVYEEGSSSHYAPRRSRRLAVHYNADTGAD